MGRDYEERDGSGRGEQQQDEWISEHLHGAGTPSAMAGSPAGHVRGGRPRGIASRSSTAMAAGRWT